MFSLLARFLIVTTLVGACLVVTDDSRSQEVVPAPRPDGDVPAGVEVLARGPVHEAFATPTAEARATPPVAKKPPAPLDEMPPDEKPEGDVVWVPGYYAWDDDRQDFLWVSGCWRVKPAGKEWVPGYWREVGAQWQWVPGFWAAAQNGQPVQVTYNPEPPAPPAVAPPGAAPAPDTFYIPGYWMWMGDRYVWRAGYWTRVRPGYVYVASHYRWTPYGYVFVPGYWDLGVARRGLLYAPVAVNPGVVGASFVYTPSYAVTDTLVLDALFVRPAYCHYYFGDYYGPRYVGLGFESCVVYSRRHYEPIIAYQRWEYRDNPRWVDIQINLYHERSAGRAPVPPRTLVQQNTVVHNVTNVTTINNVTINNTTNNIQKTQVLAPAKSVITARGQRSVPLDPAARAQVRQASVTTQQALATERRRLEPPAAAAAPPARPRVTAMSVPQAPAAAAGHAPTGGFKSGPAPAHPAAGSPGAVPLSAQHTAPHVPAPAAAIGPQHPAAPSPSSAPPAGVHAPYHPAPQPAPGAKAPGHAPPGQPAPRPGTPARPQEEKKRAHPPG